MSSSPSSPPPDSAPTRHTPDGLLIVDKPADWTSHDVVARCRRLCGTRKVGHAGTLDPMATGVLVLGVGRATRLLTFLVGCDKDYLATIRLGQCTMTDDAMGEVTATRDAAGVTDHALRAAVTELTGDIDQVPSAVSAIKVRGERAYHRVRAGEDVELPARPVTVARFEILAARRVVMPEAGMLLEVDVAVTVSSGTYVRALARDLGSALGVGGHLTALRRTRVGGFDLEHAVTLDELTALAPGPMPTLPLAEAASAAFPVRQVSAQEARRISMGQPIDSTGIPVDPVAVVGPDGALVAMLADDGRRVRSRAVFQSV